MAITCKIHMLVSWFIDAKSRQEICDGPCIEKRVFPLILGYSLNEDSVEDVANFIYDLPGFSFSLCSCYISRVSRPLALKSLGDVYHRRGFEAISWARPVPNSGPDVVS